MWKVVGERTSLWLKLYFIFSKQWYYWLWLYFIFYFFLLLPFILLSSTDFNWLLVDLVFFVINFSYIFSFYHFYFYYYGNFCFFQVFCLLPHCNKLLLLSCCWLISHFLQTIHNFFFPLFLSLRCFYSTLAKCIHIKHSWGVCVPVHQDFYSTEFLHFNRTTINIVIVVVVYCCNLWVSGCGLFLSFLIYIFQLLSCVCFVYNAIKIVFNSFRPTIFYIIFRKILFESLLSIWMQLSKCNSSLSWLLFIFRFHSWLLALIRLWHLSFRMKAMHFEHKPWVAFIK